MPVSEFMPDIVVEVAFDTPPDDPAPVWTDVSEWVEAANPISITRGRSDELTAVQPSRLTVTLDNTDGRFTPGNAASPYYPNVKKNRRIRVSATPVGSLFFDGVDDQVTVPNTSGLLAPTQQTTWEITFKVGATSDAFDTLMGFGSNDWDMRMDSMSLIRCHTWDAEDDFADSAIDVVPPNPLDDGRWHHLAIVWDGVNGIRRARLDGASVLSSAMTVGNLPKDMTAEPSFFLGAADGSRYFNGWIDEVRIWSTARTDTELDDNADATLTGTETGLTALWRFDGTGPGLTDYGPNGLHGTISGAQWAPGADVRRRFCGFVDEWPVTWPTGTDTSAQAVITASSRRARLAVGTELRSIVEEEYLDDGPAAYYPLGEPEGSTAAGDVSGNAQPNLAVAGTGNAIEFGAATGPGTDGLSAPTFNEGEYLLLDDVNLFDETHVCRVIDAFVNTSASGTDRVAVGDFSSGGGYTYIGVNSTGKATAVNAPPDGSPRYELASAGSINDGGTHHLAVREFKSGGDLTATLFVDGAEVDTAVVGGLSLYSFEFDNRFTIGSFAPSGSPASGGWIGSISHVAFTASNFELPDDRIDAHADSGLTGFEGESTDQRIRRFARLAGVPTGEVSTETGLTTSMSAAQETTGKTPIALMQEVADTEGGVLFDGRDGLLVFHARSHRYNAAITFTLDVGLQQIEASLAAKLDGQQLVNDITTTRPGGVQVRVTNPTSIDEYGVQRDQIELLTTSDNEVADAANWRINRYGEPDIRVHSVAVDVLNSPAPLLAALLDAELGDRITLTNLPAQAPTTSMDGFIDGINEVIGAESYTIAFELTPTSQTDAWVLDSATYSQLDETTILTY